MNRYFKIVFSFTTHYSEIPKDAFYFDDDSDSVKNHLIGSEPFEEEDMEEIVSIQEISFEEYNKNKK